MKFRTAAHDFSQKTQVAAHIASSRAGLGVTSGIMIAARDQQLELLATDLETSVRLRADAEIEQSGQVLVPARLIVDAGRTAAGEELSCEVDVSDQSFVVRSGRNEMRLRTLREDDFPKLPEPSDEIAVVLPGSEFVAAVGQVARAASRDESRPLLTGVLLVAEGSRLRVVATDSYRLAVKDVGLAGEVAQPFRATVPARALTEAARLAQQEGTTDVKVGTRDSQIVFSIDTVTLASRLIDGHFPDYQQLLPADTEHELRFVTAELVDVVRRVGLVAQKNTPLSFMFKEGELTVSAKTPDVGEATETIPSEFRGEPFQIGFNPAFLRDGLESVATDTLVLKLVSPLRAGVIESGGDANDGGFVYLVMPVRLGL